MPKHQTSRSRQAEHSRHLGRRYRHREPELLFARAHGLPDAQHRPPRQGRHDVHRFLRRTILHRGPLVLHHRAERLSHRPLQGRHSRRADRHEREDHHHRRGAQEPGLCDRPVRQEPSRRSQLDAADQPRLRRVLRQPLSPQRRGRAGGGRLSRRKGVSELSQDVRAARRHAFLCDGQGRSDRAAALGQGRQAENRGYRPAHQEAHGNLRRRFRRPRQGIHEEGERRRQAVLRLAQHHSHARLHPHQAGEHGAGGTLAVALSRHHDRP